MSIVEYIASYAPSTDYHVASLIKTIYRDIYRTVPHPKTGKLVWEEYINDSWQPTDVKITLRNKLSTEVAKYVIQAMDTIQVQMLDIRFESEYDYNRLKYKALFTLEGNLYRSGYKDRIIREVAEHLMVA
jgi:hypothetical protein